MKKIKFEYIIFLLSAFMFIACGDSAEETSFSLDHKVPSYEVLTDSLLVNQSDSVEIKVKVSDESGLYRLVFAYDDWLLNETVYLDNSPKEYLYEIKIGIPEDAETEWKESVTKNDGSTEAITQHYHKLLLTATDACLNVRVIPIYIRVQ
ncbi:MAG: hypothetical protein PHH37_06825 [Paludibacter sp.]|nr:hypothetical protein [Paludibacter sp.]